MSERYKYSTKTTQRKLDNYSVKNSLKIVWKMIVLMNITYWGKEREKEIIVRYLTKDPKLSAAQEQMKIVNLLTNTDRELFEEALGLWHEK